ncbi:MBL fold metallo-hydrolase RNA specificity domain-containing protein [Elusimicrobiota bacterium]
MGKSYLQFLGATETVTGSKFLLNVNGQNVLFDCGMFQGLKDLRRKNWEVLPVSPRKIDAVVLTHAHLDHSGYLPRLIKQGFSGSVHCSQATAELLTLLLPDSGHLQEEEAAYANKKGYSKHSPALPLYTEEEAREALQYIRPLDYERIHKITKGIQIRMHPTGHILGAASIEVLFENKRLVISGDVGSFGHDVMRQPALIPPKTDYVVTESTYGGRVVDNRPVEDQLKENILPVLEKRGVVVIPAFAVGRTAMVLYYLRKLQDKREIPSVPVYVDSPMATNAVEIYCRHPNEHNLRKGALSEICDHSMSALNTRFVRSVEQSKRLNESPGPAIIISASGMITGGRILHHLKNRLPNKRNLVLLVGYQAVGTRGRALKDGAKKLRMLGQTVPVRAKVGSIKGFSSHGDSDDIIRWLKTAKPKPKKVFLVHGESDELKAMASRVNKELKCKYLIPKYLQSVDL